MLAKQHYFKVVRTISSIAQQETEEKRTLYLFQDHITSKHHEFPLTTVHDLSYKKIGDHGGMLFLHVDHGVYPYVVKESPLTFIELCKRQIGKTT